jgi:hypothetical protein
VGWNVGTNVLEQLVVLAFRVFQIGRFDNNNNNNNNKYINTVKDKAIHIQTWTRF